MFIKWHPVWMPTSQNYSVDNLTRNDFTVIIRVQRPLLNLGIKILKNKKDNLWYNITL